MLTGFDANALAPGHSRPVFGRNAVAEVLGDYRDAIRHVIAETAAGINRGMTPDQLAHTVSLPERLAAKPHLTEYYGKVSWAVRAYFAGTLGWFGGNPTSLNRLSPEDEANRIAKLTGGTEQLMGAAEAAMARGDIQWSLELCDRLLAAGQLADRARSLKIDGLRHAWPMKKSTPRSCCATSA